MKKYIITLVVALAFISNPVNVKATTVEDQYVQALQQIIVLLTQQVNLLLQQLNAIQTAPPVAPVPLTVITPPVYPEPVFGSVSTSSVNTAPVVAPAVVKEIQLTATVKDPTVYVQNCGLCYTYQITDGGSVYISSYVGNASVYFDVKYLIDGKVQPTYSYTVNRTISPKPLNDDLNVPGLYTYTFEINGLTKSFKVNVLADPTNCKGRNLEVCIGEYKNSL